MQSTISHAAFCRLWTSAAKTFTCAACGFINTRFVCDGSGGQWSGNTQTPSDTNILRISLLCQIHTHKWPLMWCWLPLSSLSCHWHKQKFTASPLSLDWITQTFVNRRLHRFLSFTCGNSCQNIYNFLINRFWHEHTGIVPHDIVIEHCLCLTLTFKIQSFKTYNDIFMHNFTIGYQ